VVGSDRSWKNSIWKFFIRKTFSGWSAQIDYGKTLYGNKKLFQDGRLRSIMEKYCIEILYRKLFQGGRLRVRAKVPWRGPAYGQGCVQVNMFNKNVSIQLLQLPSIMRIRIQRLKKDV
jgi:hypothetical protein